MIDRQALRQKYSDLLDDRASQKELEALTESFEEADLEDRIDDYYSNNPGKRTH